MTPVAISLMVLMEHGATTMPMVGERAGRNRRPDVAVLGWLTPATADVLDGAVGLVGERHSVGLCSSPGGSQCRCLAAIPACECRRAVPDAPEMPITRRRGGLRTFFIIP